MPDKDVCLAKTATIQKCLGRIKDVTGLRPESLADVNAQDIFVLNLQRAVQAAIDLATHIIASEGLGVPESIKDGFARLEQAKVIDNGLSGKMQSMAGFRNIAIHDYQAINVEILKTILVKHLKDLEEFYTSVLTHFKLVDG
ncbi:MAG: transcriptional regulator [Deltaproteobacteria bacterium RIFCSPLOWO2_02_FULL_53_8]|nr:MAG: transcriptional regulator [Deltaproteobacteria bacterium RIFCSPLOWO2_02_FULL_53_8]